MTGDAVKLIENGTESPSVDTIFGTSFDLNRTHGQMSRPARLVFDRARMGNSPALRRRNYALLEDGLANLPGCRPLISSGRTIAPYLFPLWVNNLSAVFAALENAALPMQRFGQFPSQIMEENDFPISKALAENVVQFSCHQSLSVEDVAAINKRVSSVMNGSPCNS